MQRFPNSQTIVGQRDGTEGQAPRPAAGPGHCTCPSVPNFINMSQIKQTFYGIIKLFAAFLHFHFKYDINRGCL